MANKIWIGGTPAVSKVYTWTPSTTAAGTVYEVTIGGRGLRYTLGGSGEAASAIITNIVAAWNASTINELEEVTAAANATSSPTAITFTADAAGNDYLLKAAIPGAAQRNCTQTLTTYPLPTSGTWSMQFRGATTGSLAYSAAAATVTTALEGLSTIGSSNVTVTGGAFASASYTVTFQGAFAGVDVPPLVAVGLPYKSSTGTTASTITVATTQVGGCTDGSVLAITTAATGPNNWQEANNWAGGQIPQTGDDVYLQDSADSILAGLDLRGMTLASLTRDDSYSGYIGRAANNENSYPEYRDRYLRCGITTITINGDGSRTNLNVGTVQTTLTMLDSGTRLIADIPTTLFIGTHANNSIDVRKGDVGIAVYAGEVATVSTLRVGFTTSIESDSSVIIGSGSTITTISKSGGSLYNYASAATLANTGGTTYQRGGSVTTLSIYNGAVNWQTSGTAGAVTVGSAGVFDLRADMRPHTVSSITLHNGAELYDDHATIPTTCPITCTAGLDKVTLRRGESLAFNFR